MKKKLKWIVPIAILIITIVYFTMTPIGALRLRIISIGHPINAFTFEIMDNPYHIYTKAVFVK